MSDTGTVSRDDGFVRVPEVGVGDMDETWSSQITFLH